MKQKDHTTHLRGCSPCNQRRRWMLNLLHIQHRRPVSEVQFADDGNATVACKKKSLTISFRRTSPSFVILMSPDPDTSLVEGEHAANVSGQFTVPSEQWNGYEGRNDIYIFMVPLGPRFVARTL